MGSLEDFQGACAALDRLPIDNWLESVWPGQGLEHQAAESEGIRVKCARPQPPVPPLFANRNRVERSALCREHLGIKGTQPAILWQLCFQRARARKQSQRFVMEIASCAVVLLRGPCERIRVLFFF